MSSFNPWWVLRVARWRNNWNLICPRLQMYLLFTLHSLNHLLPLHHSLFKTRILLHTVIMRVLIYNSYSLSCELIEKQIVGGFGAPSGWTRSSWFLSWWIFSWVTSIAELRIGSCEASVWDRSFWFYCLQMLLIPKFCFVLLSRR